MRMNGADNKAVTRKARKRLADKRGNIVDDSGEYLDKVDGAPYYRLAALIADSERGRVERIVRVSRYTHMELSLKRYGRGRGDITLAPTAENSLAFCFFHDN